MARLRRRCFAFAASSRDPLVSDSGQAIEAVRLQQWDARTPFAQRCGSTVRGEQADPCAAWLRHDARSLTSIGQAPARPERRARWRASRKTRPSPTSNTTRAFVGCTAIPSAILEVQLAPRRGPLAPGRPSHRRSSARVMHSGRQAVDRLDHFADGGAGLAAPAGDRVAPLEQFHRPETVARVLAGGGDERPLPRLSVRAAISEYPGDVPLL